MEFGKSLREAREAKGYTIAQVAETTHVLSSVIEGLEKEDFSRIAAPIYGRGFVKLYCEVVGLEAKPFVDEFMEIVNGNRTIAIKERPVTAEAVAADPVPVAPPPPPPPSPAPAQEADLFTQSPTTEDPASAGAPAPEPEPTPTTEVRSDISRYASPFRTTAEDRAPFTLPVLPWRLILLGTVALALLAILVCGIRALYCATSPEPAPVANAAPVSSEPAKTAPEAQPAPKPQPASKPAERVRQQNIPSLYID